MRYDTLFSHNVYMKEGDNTQHNTCSISATIGMVRQKTMGRTKSLKLGATNWVFAFAPTAYTGLYSYVNHILACGEMGVFLKFEFHDMSELW